jgi:CrcB protein
MLNYFLIGLGGALGSIARYWCMIVTARHWGESFPWGTLIVNVSGSFLIGFFATLTGPEGRWPVTAAGRNFFMAGVCGGYTTFSAFSLQTLDLARNDEWFYAGANAILNLTLCLIAVWLGHALAEVLKVAKG